MLKKRPLFLVCLSFLCGMYALSILGSQVLFSFSLIVLLALSVLAVRKRCILPILMLLSFISGMLHYEGADNIYSRPLLKYSNTTVRTMAEVITIPEVSENKISYTGIIYSVVDGEEVVAVNEKVSFVHYIDKTDKDKKVAIPVLGDCVAVDGKIKLPKEAMNTGGFDYARYLKTEKIFFICEVNLEECVVTEHKNRFLKHGIENFRHSCKSFIYLAFPTEEAGILNAFIVGDKSGITEETDAAFSKSGLSHILAVSGLHVSVFLGAVEFLLKRLKLSKRKEMVISVIFAIVFIIFTGASISAIRAGTMAALALIAKLLYRKSDSLTVISAAAAVLSLFNPHVIYDGGFMLSFAATAGIILFYDNLRDYISKIYKNVNPDNKLHKLLSWICDSFAVGISAQIFTILLLVYMFNGFSLVSIIATMVLLPFLSYILIGGLFFIFVSFISTEIALIISFPLKCLTSGMLFVAEFFSAFPFSQILHGVLTPFIILLYALFVCSIVAMIRKKKIVYIISVVSLSILSLTGIINYRIHFNLANVSFLNVGQGDCALIKAPGDCDILIDAGGYSMSETTGEYIISPYLLKNGVTDIEYVMISHIDSDHTIGLSGLLKNHKIDNLIIPYGQQYNENYLKLEALVKNYNTKILLFSAGASLKINEAMSIIAITPDAEQYKYSRSLNDTGMVLRLDYGENAFLFSGDITSTIEKYLLSKHSEINDIDVLKVAHHGSKNSTCQEFIDAVNPKYAFISVGKNNFGHPDLGVIEKLTGKRTQVYISEIDRDVTFYFDEREIKGVRCSKYQAGE